MARQAPPSLDRTGTQAAVYPSEETLWTQGPPINDPGSQGVEYPGSERGTMPPVGPPSLSAAQRTEDFIHEVMNGETPNEAYVESVIPTGVYGPTGLGDWNEQQFQSGHSQNIQANPSSEQGWGVGPARRWAHYPKSDGPNPYRNEGQHLRNGQLAWVYGEENYLYYRTQLAWEQQWDPYKRRSPVAPVVQVPASVPFVQTVPTYGGGDIPHPGVDIPYDDALMFGGYYP